MHVSKWRKWGEGGNRQKQAHQSVIMLYQHSLLKVRAQDDASSGASINAQLWLASWREEKIKAKTGEGGRGRGGEQGDE